MSQWDVRYARWSWILPGRMLLKGPSMRLSMGLEGNKPRRDHHSSCGTIGWSWEAYIQLNIALNSYELQGQVLATILSWQTPDISLFVQHGWYDWIKYYYNHVRHPEPEEVYSNWLCPSVSIGSVMTSKILKQNAQILHLSTFCGLD